MFLFLNLKKIYNYPKINLLVSFCVSFFRILGLLQFGQIHTLPLIFLTIDDTYLENSQKNKKIYYFLNLLFTAFATL